MFEKRVERVYAAATERLLDRLDTDRPNWLTAVPPNAARIDQATVDRCVLSLVYGHFVDGRRSLRRRTGRITWAEHRVIVPPPWQRDRINRLVRASVRRRRVEAAGLDRELRDLVEANRR